MQLAFQKTHNSLKGTAVKIPKLKTQAGAIHVDQVARGIEQSTRGIDLNHMRYDLLLCAWQQHTWRPECTCAEERVRLCSFICNATFGA